MHSNFQFAFIVNKIQNSQLFSYEIKQMVNFFYNLYANSCDQRSPANASSDSKREIVTTDGSFIISVMLKLPSTELTIT